MDRSWLLSLCLVSCASPEGPPPVELSNRIVELEQENARLRMAVERLETRLRALETDDVTVCELPPPIDARVLELDRERKTLVLDKGARDGVEPGYLFYVYSGNTYKGQVRVTEVDEATCIAELVVERQPMRPGDDATIAL